jgi:hypothetical protein
MIEATDKQVEQAYNNTMYMLLNAIQAKASASPAGVLQLAEAYAAIVDSPPQCSIDMVTEEDEDLFGDQVAITLDSFEKLNQDPASATDLASLLDKPAPLVVEQGKIVRSENVMFAIKRKGDGKWYGTSGGWTDKKNARFYTRKSAASCSLNYAKKYGSRRARSPLTDDYEIVQFDMLEREAA